MSAELKSRNYMLEGLLELGRNWALAVAIASAGITFFRTETIDGPIGWEKNIFIACIITSIAFMFIAVLRFDEGLSHRLKGRTSRILGLILYATLIATGFGLVLLVGEVADNNAIVKICDSPMATPDTRVYKADECVRLRSQRKALWDRLEDQSGKEGSNKGAGDR
ncbi:hypothetical protein [Xanthomonas sacchari]|uniref:hypothetical protein n=1 Tax=Xanthomonas sacchari TaxID=56458 RepID=UPI002259C212|nr:hypothetical protein [Xanthomonas sacchari]